MENMQNRVWLIHFMSNETQARTHFSVHLQKENWLKLNSVPKNSDFRMQQ